MKNIKLILIALVGILAVGCYNDFETPAPEKIWTVAEVDAMGLTPISIKTLKDRFGALSNRGTNSSWAQTNTLKLGAAADFEKDFVGMTFWPEAANYYIKGKVISSDQQGNIYKSLFIDDGTAGIELKLTGTLFTTYKLDLATMESQWVYVKLKDLYLGNYRMMLSIGDSPSMSYNAAGRIKYYANSSIAIPRMVEERVLPGERVLLEEGVNYKTVNSSTYTSLGQDDFGRLIRFEGVKVIYTGVTYQNEELINPNAPDPYANDNIKRDGAGQILWAPAVTKPNITSGGNSNPYPNWIVTDEQTPQFGAWYYWAYSREGTSLYGSVLMSYVDAPQFNSQKGVYSIRTSGYSRFAMKPIPRDGTVGNVLGIYGIYASKSDYTGDANDWAQYQITVSRIEDLGFPQNRLLSKAWIEKNTPASSYKPPVKDGTGNVESAE